MPKKKKALTRVNVVLDKSGSMAAVRDDTIGGFNRWLADQQAVPGECLVSLTLFDTKVEQLFTARPIAQVAPLSEKTYRPEGFTALLDAVGRTIADTERVAAAGERVLTVIITDGYENSSHEYTKAALKKVIEARQKDGWEFVYLAAHEDAFAEAGAIGVPTRSSAMYSSTQQGTQAAFQAVSNTTLDYRGGATATIAQDLRDKDSDPATK